MFRFRPWLLWVALICTGALSSKLGATPPLATISDTLFNADGTYFNGVVVISWPSFEASDTSNVAAGTQNIHGQQWKPVCPTGPHHQRRHRRRLHQFNTPVSGSPSSARLGPCRRSILPFRVRDVRLAAGSVSGSAPAAATIITIGDVTGLQSALNVRPRLGTALPSPDRR